MELKEYQEFTASTNLYGESIDKLYVYQRSESMMKAMVLALGLNEEAGEVAGVIKKILRDDNGVLIPEKLEKLEKELGDVCWYISELCNHFGFSFQNVLNENYKKLKNRQERGKLQGSGDNR